MSLALFARCFGSRVLIVLFRTWLWAVTHERHDPTEADVDTLLQSSGRDGNQESLQGRRGGIVGPGGECRALLDGLKQQTSDAELAARSAVPHVAAGGSTSDTVAPPGRRAAWRVGRPGSGGGCGRLPERPRARCCAAGGEWLARGLVGLGGDAKREHVERCDGSCFGPSRSVAARGSGSQEPRAPRRRPAGRHGSRRRGASPARTRRLTCRCWPRPGGSRGGAGGSGRPRFCVLQ
jgi:hypothetical protein